MRCNAASRRASVSASERRSRGSSLAMDQDNKAEAATEQMFAAVGRAITQWSFAEHALCNIFIACSAASSSRIAQDDDDDGSTSWIDHQVPTAVFHSVENFRGKLKLIDAALLARVPDYEPWGIELREDWARLREKARKLSLKRNRLAHWTVIPAVADETFYDAKLMPPYGSPGWWEETAFRPAGNSLTRSQVEHLEYAYYLLEIRLRGFWRKLAQSRELSDKYDQLTVRLVRSHDRLNPNRGERIRRDLASPEE